METPQQPQINSDQTIDPEVNAINVIMAAVKSLAPDAQGRVIEYVLKRTGVTAGLMSSQQMVPTTIPMPIQSERAVALPASSSTPTDIRSFKELKKPRSAIEMAVLVAYYLSEIAQGDQHSDVVNPSHISKYFKEAAYELPSQAHKPLANAKDSGYLESAGHGAYRLNAVGHNLIAHKLPSDSGTAAPAVRRKKAVPKKGGKKSARK